MKIVVALARYVPSFAEVEMDLPDELSDEEIIKAASDWCLSNTAYLKFIPSNSYSDGLSIHDISKVKEGLFTKVSGDIPLDYNFLEMGVSASLYLEGVRPLQALLDEAKRQGLPVRSSVKEMPEYCSPGEPL